MGREQRMEAWEKVRDGTHVALHELHLAPQVADLFLQASVVLRALAQACGAPVVCIKAVRQLVDQVGLRIRPSLQLALKARMRRSVSCDLFPKPLGQCSVFLRR